MLNITLLQSGRNVLSSRDQASREPKTASTLNNSSTSTRTNDTPDELFDKLIMRMDNASHYDNSDGEMRHPSMRKRGTEDILTEILEELWVDVVKPVLHALAISVRQLKKTD